MMILDWDEFIDTTKPVLSHEVEVSCDLHVVSGTSSKVSCIPIESEGGILSFLRMVL